MSATALRKRAAKRVTVHDALRAWCAGAFERCLELCAAARPRDAASRVHFALLNARALLRLDRPKDALRALNDVSAVPCGTDEAATLRMLTGAAHVRADEVDRGVSILLAAQTDSLHAHRTIRSEIALNLALAHYGRREFDEVERSLDGVDNAADIVYARALEYRGWVAYTRTDANRARTMFVAALDALDSCRHYDRFLEANCIRALAHLAVERLDRETWSIVESRRARMDWSADGLAQPRFWIAYCASAYASDVEGNLLKAAREARHAEQIAPTPAYRVQARCKRASIARFANEPVSQRDHTESSVELFANVNLDELSGDETLAPLVLAEQLAHVPSADEARRVLEAYRKLAKTSAMLYISHSPAVYAYQKLVEATVHEATGERRTATQRYREAFETFARIGYRRRATIAALGLFRLTSDEKAAAYANTQTRHVSSHSWMKFEVKAMKTPTLRLTTVQREVLAQICQGKSNPDIAASRKRSLHTIRNLVARLFVIFAVSSREELAVECVRRGLYAPK